MQVEKVQIGTDFLYQNPCHKKLRKRLAILGSNRPPENP